jgi:lipopolysaccharide heptosyltransferase II
VLPVRRPDMEGLPSNPLRGRVLVAQTAFLGDLALTTALLRGVRTGLAPRRLDVLLGRPLQELLSGSPYVDRVLVFDKRGPDRGWSGMLRTARALRGEYDVALVAVRSLRTSLLLAAARIPLRIGFAGHAGAALFHEAVPWHESRPRVEQLCSLAAAVDWAAVGETTKLSVTSEERLGAEGLWREAGLDPARPTVALHPGSTWPTKRWPAERFGHVARELCAEGIQALVVGAPQDVELGEQVRSEAGPGAAVANLCGKTGLGQLKASLARARLVVTNDSGPLHVAEALGTPVVAVFGATRPEQGFGPRLARSRVAEVELGCRPCGRHGHRSCPLGHFRCMLDLPSDQVLERVQDVLRQEG